MSKLYVRIATGIEVDVPDEILSALKGSNADERSYALDFIYGKLNPYELYDTEILAVCEMNKDGFYGDDMLERSSNDYRKGF